MLSTKRSGPGLQVSITRRLSGMNRMSLLFILGTFVCHVSLLHGLTSKCDKWRTRMEKKNPRFRIQDGIVTCHELTRKYVSKCNGHMLVPKRGHLLKNSDYAQAISDRMTSINHKVTWRVDNTSSGCGYRKNVQCTWRFPMKADSEGHVLFWRTALEYHLNCTNDYIVVDVFVDNRVDGAKIPPNCVSVLRYPHYCRLEYKLGCGSFCDPTFTADGCKRSAASCKDESSSCHATPLKNVFRVSTTEPELNGLKIDYIHVTFVSDSSTTCSGFEGMFTAFKSGWSGAVSFGVPPNQSNDNTTFPEWLESRKDYIKGYHHGYQLPDFKYGQTYSSEDRIRIFAHANQDTNFLNKLKNHTLFSSIVQME